MHLFIATISCYISIAASFKSQILYGLYRFNEDQKRQIVTIHNKLRAQEPASNMQELVWDDRLADLAYGHVQRCDAWHRSAYERQGHGYSYIGENIWWSNEAFLRPNLQSAMLDFFNEKPYYNYYTNRCWQNAQCGHYTQYVWAETCAVGCAAVHCDGIKNGRGINKGHIIVCNYGEGGNMFGKRPYQIGPRCSKCKCGGNCTSEGLCQPCCNGLRYPQDGTFWPSESLRLRQQSQKLWLDKMALHQKSKVQKENEYNDFLTQVYLGYQCRDFERYCDYWAQTVGCKGEHEDFMTKRCPKTCNTCHEVAATVIRKCVDNSKSCYSWVKNGQCFGPRKLFMRTNCKLSCGFCKPPKKQRMKDNNTKRRNGNKKSV
ncbi:unnamed protein product [Thelazia callipaeda]|uniref:ShKT domain-containing protein n=1 Tax=Thelazia callipaeda TaxID=103827 RepID=A0A0N5CS75_THECL|nr:unnamed protein product [Thelazia callipaeda]